MFTWLTDRISANLAFFPPPPSYEINHRNDHEIRIKSIQPGILSIPRAKCCTISVNKRTKEEIIGAFIPALNPTQYTILLSHGNAVDLSQMFPFLDYLSRILHINVACYDYRGYGLSDGVPSVSATLDDILAVFSWLKSKFGIDEGDVILYGQSVGSGPTSWLASNKSIEVAGVVLHSPFMSGIRVLMNPDLKFWPLPDIYPNHKHVQKIAAKVLVIHGMSDKVITFEHGKLLHSLCRNPSGKFPCRVY